MAQHNRAHCTTRAPPTGIRGAVDPADRVGGEGVAALNALLTQHDFENMASSLGGRAAWKKQRYLGTSLLTMADRRELYLTESDFNWKAVLKSLSVGADIVGTGVSKLTFRLLSDVRDPNYITVDSGKRHAFRNDAN